ncbi:MAG: lmo0937 family membrane protein [Candidatus Acidiferrales bacterium]
MGFLFLGLFVLLFLAWIFSFLVFHITGGLIHILLVLAIISIIVHFARRASHA